MKAITAKVRSRRGASITYALLLFVVCAAISSVVIVAGSAAGGRVSKLRETDQRYYAVTSAAELLTKVFSNAPAVTVEEKTDGQLEIVDPTGGDSVVAEASKAIVRAAALKADQKINLTLTVSGHDKLTCDIVATAKANGLMTFVIGNGAAGSQYTLELTLSSNLKKVALDAGESETVKSKTVVTWKMNGISNPRPATAGSDDTHTGG